MRIVPNVGDILDQESKGLVSMANVHSPERPQGTGPTPRTMRIPGRMWPGRPDERLC